MMTKAACRAMALRHLDEATRQGLPVGDPDRADRLDHLMGVALALVGADFPPAGSRLVESSDHPRAHPLPGDFVGLMDVTEMGTGRAVPHRVAGAYLHLPPGESAEVRYRRRPGALPPDAPDGTPLDLPEGAAHLLPLRLAALAAAPEDPGLSAHLMNLYVHGAKALRPAPLPPRSTLELRYGEGEFDAL